VQGDGCRAQGSASNFESAGFRVKGPGSRVKGSGFRIQGSEASNFEGKVGEEIRDDADDRRAAHIRQSSTYKTVKSRFLHT